jgi:phospholipid/cholesterol/gamma-HCH transport system ATP-binding protein
MKERSLDRVAVDPAWGTPPEDDIVIEFRDVHRSFGDLEILKGISITVPRGTSSVVMGGSGTGKSVLLKHIVKLLNPDSGEVWLLGRRVDQMDGDDLDALRLRTGYLFQGGALFDSMNVYENMSFILERHSGLSPGEQRDRIEETLEWVNLPNTSKQYPSELSGGQKKRIGLARSIILQPQVMLYDEPTTGLDPVSVRTVSELIVRLREERGITSVTITHDLVCAEMIADEVHFLSEGHIVASGAIEEVRSSERDDVRNFFGA